MDLNENSSGDHNPKNTHVRKQLEKANMDLKHENMLLKVELQAALENHAREVLELKKLLEAEKENNEKTVTCLQADLNSLQVCQHAEDRKLRHLELEFCQKERHLQDELSKLQQKCEDLLAQKKSLSDQLRSVSSEHVLTFNKLKVENQHLKGLVKQQKLDLECEKKLNHEREMDLAAERHQIDILKVQIKEIEEASNVHKALFSSEVAAVKTHLEDNQQQHSEKVKELNEALQQEKASHKQTTQALLKLQTEFETNINTIKQSYLQELGVLMQESNSLMKHSKKLEEGQQATATAKEKQIHNMMKQLEDLSRDRYDDVANVVSQNQLVELNKLCSLLAEGRRLNTQLQDEKDAINLELDNLKMEHHQMETDRNTLLDRLNKCELQLKDYCEKQLKEATKERNVIFDQHSSGKTELMELTGRMASLEVQLSSRNQEYVTVTNRLNEKLSTYRCLIKKLRSKLELASLKEKDLETHLAVVREEYIPVEEYKKVKKQLESHIHRENEFAAVIEGLQIKTTSGIGEIEDLRQQAHLEMNLIEEEQLTTLSSLNLIGDH